ncbi:MAG: SRPBCC domain-containing protein [Chloroflexota bacterium]|nr:SRPBCC domain-containing protein [Chloroflexota bacterium]
MVRSIHAEIDIDAPAERVWGVLTDFDSFPRWNPFVRRAGGELRTGGRLTIHLQLSDRIMTFDPLVIKLEPNRELRWLARQKIPNMFDVERIFTIRPRGDGGVRFIQHEDCTGLLVPPLLKLGLERDIRRGYERLNLALKALAEEGAAWSPVAPPPPAAAAS